MTELDIFTCAPSNKVTLQDGLSSIDVTGLCADGSDDIIASPTTAEAAVIDVIGRMRKIEPVKLQAKLCKGATAESFQFSRVWKFPRTIFHLSSGQLYILEVSFLVADDELIFESVIIGRPVLENVKIDTVSLLDQNREHLYGTD